ncbi:TPA: type VI secretion protein VasK, partial [Escherichia coli O25b:H4-ST131]|nr:type VI secretion protein VasK [Escherichia coli O25b:H4-ST131]
MTVAVVVALCTFIHRKPALLGVEPGSSQQMYWMAGVIAAGVVFLIIMGVYHLLNRHAAVQNFELRRQLAAGDDYRAVTTKKADSRHPAMVELAAFLRDRYGPFWRRKIRLLLVTGEPEQAEAIAPGLTGQ